MFRGLVGEFMGGCVCVSPYVPIKFLRMKNKYEKEYFLVNQVPSAGIVRSAKERHVLSMSS